MKVSSSNLALRFYKCDGWSMELLESLITNQGTIHKSAHFDKDGWPEIDQYYLYDVGTTVDTPELMKHVTSVYRRFDDYPNETDEEFIKRML